MELTPTSYRGSVDVGGRSLFVESEGTGTPTVILEAGAGCALESWDPIWNALVAHTRVVRYDRANVGKSDAASKPRTCEDIARDLYTALSRIGIAGPLLLVGHSFGGLCVRTLAQMYPNEVVGMILVDASHPNQQERGLVALPPQRPSEPEAVRSLRAWSADPGALNSEGARVGAGSIQLDGAGALGNMPLVVLSRSQTVSWPGFPSDVSDALEQAWQEMQIDLTTLSSDCHRIVAERSGHHVQRDEPELVVSAILDVLKAIATKTAKEASNQPG